MVVLLSPSSEDNNDKIAKAKATATANTTISEECIANKYPLHVVADDCHYPTHIAYDQSKVPSSSSLSDASPRLVLEFPTNFFQEELNDNNDIHTSATYEQEHDGQQQQEQQCSHIVNDDGISANNNIISSSSSSSSSSSDSSGSSSSLSDESSLFSNRTCPEDCILGSVVDVGNDNDNDSTASIYYSAMEHRPSNRFENLMLELDLREELLTKITKGIDRSYTNMLQQHELMTRKLILDQLIQQQDDQLKSNNDNEDSDSADKKIEDEHIDFFRKKLRETRLDFSADHGDVDDEEKEVTLIQEKSINSNDIHNNNMGANTDANIDENNHVNSRSSTGSSHPRNICIKSSSNPFSVLFNNENIKFEIYNTIPGFAVLLMYCLAHVSIYELLNAILLETTEHIQRQNLLYLSIMVIGLLLSRISGMVYNFLNDAKYNCIKFEYRNRLKLNFVDAKIIKWFNNNHYIKGAIDILAFYFCYLSVVYFWYKLSATVDQRRSILRMLPSRIAEMEDDEDDYDDDSGDDDIYEDDDEYGDELGDYMCLASSAILYLPPHSDMVDATLDDYWNSGTDIIATLYERANMEFADYEYLYTQLGKSSYYNFAGADYEAPLYHATGAILFFTGTAFISLYTLSRFGYCFWDKW